MIVYGFCPVGGNTTFSTEIAAKNYKEQNEKKYSELDIKKAFEIYVNDMPKVLLEKVFIRNLNKLKYGN